MGGNLERELEPLLPRTTRLRTFFFCSRLLHLSGVKGRQILVLLPSKSQLAPWKGDDAPSQEDGRARCWWEMCGIYVGVVRHPRGVSWTDDTQEVHGGNV